MTEAVPAEPRRCQRRPLCRLVPYLSRQLKQLGLCDAR
jgi:hypothetical protein